MRAKISKKLKKIFAGLLLSAVFVAIILIFGSTQNEIVGTTRNTAESLENIFYDIFFKVHTHIDDSENTDMQAINAVHYDPNIIIVDIDEASLAKLGNYYEWDRSIHANVIRNLSKSGASAISLDILFKTADFGKQKSDQVMDILRKVTPDAPLDSIYPSVKTNYNFDSMLVDAVQESGNTIVCDMFDIRSSYQHKSQWEPLSTTQRAEEIGYQFTLSNSQVDNIDQIEGKDLLDNVFPELARAGAGLGSVNVFPDNDGVVRKVAMLYRFPNPELYPDDSSRVYPTMSLMTILHLFHKDFSEIKVKTGKYIDLGKPFGIYRDKDGVYHTTYPNFSYPMFLSLKEKTADKHLKKAAGQAFVDISSKVFATKDKNGNILFDIYNNQSLNVEFSKALLNLTVEKLDSIPEDKTVNLGNGIVIKRGSQNKELFILKNLAQFDEEDEEEDEEDDLDGETICGINKNIIQTISYFKDSIPKIPVGKIVPLSLDMDIHYDKKNRKWRSSQVIISDAVLRDIQKTSNEAIQNLKPGEELRFGPVKRIPINNQAAFRVNYKGHYNITPSFRTFQHLSYYDVYVGRFDASSSQGNIYILGSAATALFDYHPVPNEENFAAVLIHANIIKNILEDDYLTILSEKYQQIIVILLALICLFLGLYFKSYISVSISILLMGIYTYVAYRYFEGGLYIGVSKQLLSILLTSVTALAVQFYFENKEKSFINNAFKQYISPELIDAMVDQEIMPTLGGEKSNITAYFTDIASFSTFSEKIGDPSKLVELLNEYLTAMTDTLLSNKGTLDKYEGDAIIAFFGAPMPLPNHAQNACDSAIDMQNKLRDLRKKWAHEGDKWPKVVHDMHMRIGINSGDIVTGNMGSTMRKNYTMMGDAVNLAARLESAAKQYGAYIQISEDTQAHLEDGRFIYRSLDTIRVIGKSQPVKTFELLERRGSENESSLLQLVDIWEKARTCYLNMQWDNAIELFKQCLDLEPHHPDRDPGSKTTPSHVYIKRCMAYKENPPVAEGEVWDGVFTATEK
ncbi:CHASE2 domain-containing protein [uncultured Fibrobacter sp.]|uniref:CHASE2 domain-containing protein n=1 Tax=uncultured Fibrobacter sp. TaxID=261512 RepID=UPI00261697BD|nr:CHASE2 domain-containing protein [uncultured Fibrobacter sp.]